jgi:hypothetical protein
VTTTLLILMFNKCVCVCVCVCGVCVCVCVWKAYNDGKTFESTDPGSRRITQLGVECFEGVRDNKTFEPLLFRIKIFQNMYPVCNTELT